MKILNVKGNTYCIDTGLSYIPFYKLENNRIIMLDTGLKKGERKGIEALFDSYNFTVAAIINSHFHIDHIGNNAYFKNKYDSIIAMCAYEAIICSSEVNLKLYYSSETLKVVNQQYSHMVCDTDVLIRDDQEEICICGINFRLLHTPGHSPSHICIITPDNVAYVGDCLISNELMGTAKLPYSYILSEDMKSKAKLYDLTSDKYIVAHKGIYNNIQKLIDDNIDFYEAVSFKIYDLIDKPMSIDEITKAVSDNFAITIFNANKYKFTQRLLKSYIEYLYEIKKLNIIIKDGFLKYTK